MQAQLSSVAIFSHLSSQVQQLLPNNAIEVYDTIDSTQDYLKQSLAEAEYLDSAPIRLVAAESQQSGKGRMNREWHATSGENILMSCSWVYDDVPKDLAGLSLAVVVSLAERLQQNFSVPISIKWPNDLLLSGAKVAGLLVDVETGQQCKVIVGLGLNISQSFSADALGQAWSDLAQHGVSNVDRNVLIADIFSDWATIFMNYSLSGFAPYQDRWNALSEHKGKKIALQKTQAGQVECIVGEMEGVDANGFLLIRVDGKVHAVSDSSYSLRLAT